YHNQARYTDRPTPATAAAVGIETSDAWTQLAQLGDQLPRLVRELRTDRAQLAPESVRARLAEAEATARRAVERANTAERRATEAEDEADRLVEGAEAEHAATRAELATARDELERL